MKKYIQKKERQTGKIKKIGVILIFPSLLMIFQTLNLTGNLQGILSIEEL